MPDRSTLLLPAAILGAGVAVGLGLAVSGGGSGDPSRSDRRSVTPAAATAMKTAKIEISEGQAADRLLRFAADTGLFEPQQLASAACVTETGGRTTDGRFVCLGTRLAPTQINGARVAAGQPGMTWMKVIFTSSQDTEPRIIPTQQRRGDLDRIDGARQRRNERLYAQRQAQQQGATVPDTDGLNFAGATVCNEKMTVKDVTCSEAARISDAVHMLDDGQIGAEDFVCKTIEETINSCTSPTAEFRVRVTA